ncbi:MAG: hypothetical protein COY81_00930 [Candidatus Pacebacteria bacterium CG_4_10_14_0_8_um_filter_43_12]|nr:MAG: hypothetical protein COU66_03225 [Candidatus Pacebacteria bacterium CG10_big_fil_rev_8_21_14_0_10_44_11]PIY79787.1 MAG: hypothetical protein COY81_00930 [Candidatus Pacebacteria bacterium CG_4_10_14_0_8_um_filter_43_12]
MAKGLPEILTETVQISFPISKSGLYAISITARCKDSSDLRVEIDNRLFREIPPKKNIQKYDIPPAWNGNQLRGLQQTNVFLIKLESGEHTLTFFPKGQATVETWDFWAIDDSTDITFNLDKQAEDGDKRPWFSFVLVDLPLVSVLAQVSVSWHYFDGDDAKVAIDNQLEPNPNSLLWRNWVWHATPIQLFSGPKKEQKIFTKNLSSGMHYLELWADKTPTLHQVSLNLGKIDLKQKTDQISPIPTVSNPEWTGNFADDPDQIILARVLFGEARNTLVPDEARIAIGWVIKNRVDSSGWSNSYREVITTPSQFSSFNRGDDNRPFVENPLYTDNPIDKKAWEHAYELAGKIISNEIEDPTKGANHYYDDSISTPSWAENQQLTLTISYLNQYEKKVSIFFFQL